MKRVNSDAMLIMGTVEAMKEKLIENNWKKPITDLTLPQALLRMKEELVELAEELNKADTDYKAIRRELADVVNFAGAAIIHCDREILRGKIG